MWENTLQLQVPWVTLCMQIHPGYCINCVKSSLSGELDKNSQIMKVLVCMKL